MAARLVTIKRSGDDGAHFPLSLSSCLFGRSIECDIRIQLPVVSKKHCKIEVKGQEAVLYNFSSTNPTQVNGTTIDEPVHLKHGDIITIIDRSFRYENGSHEDGSKSAEFPGKSLGQHPARRASRATFSADPDGRGQDVKASKITASRRSLVHAKGLTEDYPASDGSKDSVTQDLPGHVEQHGGRNIGEPISGDLFRKFRATGSTYRELTSSPAPSPSNSKKSDYPFEELYQSMKEQLIIKSQKLRRRKSEPQPDCATGKETLETQLFVSCKARPKSSGGTPVTLTSSHKVEKIYTERQSSNVEPVQTSTEALSSSFSLSETAKMKTPVRKSQELKDEDVHVTGGKESVNPDEREDAKVVHKIVTPRKLVTRNQTSVEVEDAVSPAGTSQNPSSRKRKSIPAKVEVQSAQTQKRLSSTPCLAPGERKTPKDSFSGPEKLATTAKQICSELPGLSSVDISNFGESINKSEGMSLKKRRVSFGGCLRPELFDENLPPNTPLKRGETPNKRKSLATHSPAVLKKIIKVPPQSPGKQESPGITPPRANDQRRRSGRTSPTSSGSKSLYQADTPKKAGRKSSNLPAKRTSISRSQHGILQMISSKRRSGASEANLIVAKSWADVVKLGSKQAQIKVVKYVPQKQTSKRQRRSNTPKKPTSTLHNQFSTGHANSPCTIVIGRAQIEKVSMPARPYKMLNNLMLNQKMDFSEDLSGLSELFKTPGKEKQQRTSDTGSVLSSSGNLPEKQVQETNSGDTPLAITSEILGENVPFGTQNAAKEPSDKYSASPSLRRQSIKNGNIVQTPKNVHNITHLEKKTPGSGTEPSQRASSVSGLRRSRQLRHHTLVESSNEKTEVDLADGITGRYLRKTSLRGQEVDLQVQDYENSSQKCKENIELKEGSEKTSSARDQKPTEDLIGRVDRAEELLNQEQGTKQNPEESMHMQNTPASEDQGATKQKVGPVVYATKVKRWPKTPDKKTQLLEGPAGLKEPFETPNLCDDKTKVLCKSPQPTTENTKTSKKARASASGKKVNTKEEELPAQTKLVHVSGGTRHTPKVPGLEQGDIKALKESEYKMLSPTVIRSKRSLGKAKEKAQPLEDMAGFQELFLSPAHSGEIRKMPSKSHLEPVRTPASTKRLSNMSLRVDVRELSVTEKQTQSPGRATQTPAPEQEENDATAFMETPKQKLDFTGNSVGSKRRSRTPKIRAQPLEDLDDVQELFQTPAGDSDPVTVEETAKMSLESPQPVRTPASTKRLSKTGLGQVDVREKLSTTGKRTKSPGRAARTPASMQEENDATAFMETPKQKLDFTGNSVGSKRRSRTPKIRAQPLEDLDDVQELFQTPAGDSDPVTVGETTKMSLESPQPEPVRTPASTKRLSNMGLRKVDVRELSIPEKQTQSPGRATYTPAPVQEENDATALMETPKQKLDFTGNSVGSKRRSRTPKIRAQPPEHLDGVQELFQTPAGDSDPVTVGETAKMSLESPQPEPIRTPASTKRLSKMGLGQVDVKDILSTTGKRTKSPGRAAQTPAPVQQEKKIKTTMETSNQKLESIGNLTAPERKQRPPKEQAPSLEDLTGMEELFQTPEHGSGPLVVGKTKAVSLNSPQPEPIITIKSIKRRSRASMGKMDMKEEILQSEQHPQSGEATDTLQVPTDNRVIRASKQPVKRKLDPTASMPDSKRVRRATKDKTPCLEDLSSIQQLFQTPGYAKDSLTIGETKKMLTKSPQSGPVRTQTSRKSLTKISHRKMDVTKLSEFWEHSPGRSPAAPVQDNGLKAIMETPKEKLETATDVTELTRQPRATKENVQPLENLDGFQELFKTPGHSTDPLTGNKKIRMSLKSPQPGLARTPQTSKRLTKTNLGKVGVREMLSPLNMLRQATGEVVHTPRGPEDDGRGVKDVKESTTKTRGPSASVTVSKRQQGACKERSQSLEDLFGVQELFQTPASSKDPVTVGESTKMSLESPQTGYIRTLASTKRLSNMGLRKVDVRELSIPEKQTQSPGRATYTPAPVQEENDATALMETPKQKLDFTGNSVGSKRRSRTPKIRAQPLEDLDGVQELFQTPAGDSDPVTVGETTKTSLESPQPEPIRTPASTKRLSKTGLGQVDVREKLSTTGKRTKSPGRAAPTVAPVQEENDATAFMETPKQKLDFTGNSVGSKRRSQTPKIRAQPLEDLDGVQELFQTPAGASDPVTVGETAKMSLESPQPEPVRTPGSTKRLFKTGLGQVDMREELSPLNKPRCASHKVMHASRLPEDDGRRAKDVKKSLAQTLDPTVHVTHSKRQQGPCKKRSQSLEDLFGLQELPEVPSHDKDSVGGKKLTKMPCRSPPQPKGTSVTSQRQPRTNLRKVHVKNELSGDRMLPEISGEIMDSSRVPEGEDKVIRTRKQPIKRKLDTAVSVPGSKRQRVTRAEKAQTLEDLPAFQELYQAPSLAVDSLTVDKTRKMPSKSPESVDTTSGTQPGRRLRKLGVAEEPVAQRKTTRVLRETRNTHKEPMGNSKGVKEFKDSSTQKQDSAISLTGRRNQPRIVKKTQPLEELTSSQEETSTGMSCTSPQVEEKEITAASKRRLRIQVCKVDVKEELTAQRKPPGRATRNTLKEPMGDSMNVEEELKQPTKQKIDPAASVPVSKRPRRVPREKAQPLELPGLKGPIQTPGHTEESVSDKRPTQMPCNSLQAEQVDSLQASPRRPRTRRGKVEVDEEPSVVKKTMPASRQTMRTCKIPEIDGKGTQASKEPVKQKVDTAANVTGSRRRLRAHKDEVQPLEVLGDSKEITQISDHSEKLHDTSDLKSILQQMPDSAKPLRTCRRVQKASQEDPMEMSVDTRDPAASESKSNASLPPKSKSSRDGSISRTRGLRSMTQKQEATEEKPVPKTRRAARSKRHVSPEPVKMKHLRIMSNKIEPVEEQISNIKEMQEKEDSGENSVTSDQSSRYRKKTNEKQLRLKVDASAEKVEIKKNEKTVKFSQETELHNPDDGAKKSTSRGKVSGRRTCLRSAGQSETPQPPAAEEKTSKPAAEISVKTQKEKGVSADSDVRRLRSKKTGATLDSESKPRVTQGAKKGAKIPKKDEDIVYTRKLRTRRQPE
ncbi:proliferation marker protein Ki-67 [Acomys russatus]|uniref:proliferation marker protein Ki-67 n=1 Tax=Acomys russatus TaxID=60746 RepID=UPI0021E275CA|nr:proliferation marker protein Ki-67 [Acomys russatus]